MTSDGWSLTVPREVRERLLAHLFPGDGDEHGAVLLAGVVEVGPARRLLAREVILARDGIDYVPGTRGYRQLTATFVRDAITRARDEDMAYLAVHNHGGAGEVAFSGDDMRSHERGYPALLDIADGSPVGGLVVADGAIAGDIWTRGGRHALVEARLLGPRIEQWRAAPPRVAGGIDPRLDRSARLFGDLGQQILAGCSVGIIGAGGMGMLLTEYLARGGVGRIVIADPDRVDVTNLPRLPGAGTGDARAWFSDPRWPGALHRWGDERRRPEGRARASACARGLARHRGRGAVRRCARSEHRIAVPQSATTCSWRLTSWRSGC